MAIVNSVNNKNVLAAITAAVEAYLQIEQAAFATAGTTQTKVVEPKIKVSFWRVLRYMFFNR
jgi:hypothetical protein